MPDLAALRQAWTDAGTAFAEAAIAQAEALIKTAFPTAKSYETEGTYEEIGSDPSIHLVSVTLADGTVIDEDYEGDDDDDSLDRLWDLDDVICNDGFLNEAVVAGMDYESWDDVMPHDL